MSTLAPVNSIPGSDSQASGPNWSLPERVAFRFAFCYLGGYCIFNGNATAWDVLPNIGNPISNILSRVFALPAQYLAQHLFHVPPPGNQLHPTGSGDTAINWIALLILFCASIVATAIWTGLDRRRAQYRTLAAWLRFVIRLTVATGMVFYGMAKVFPLQMSPPQISSLSEPLGMHSPMMVLWNFIGLNPYYEMVCGTAELLGGLLLLFRRTALVGALFSTFVISNILLYNLCFDVPVKLYASHLLLLSLFLVLPDAAALFRFFWQHQPAAPAGVWVPPGTRTWFRRSIVVFEITFAVLAVGGSALGEGKYWRRNHAQLTTHCDLCGAWTIDRAAHESDRGAANATTLPSPFIQPADEFIINGPDRAVLRNSIGVDTDVPIKSNLSAHTLELDGPAGNKVLLAVTQPTPMPHYFMKLLPPRSTPTHLVLTPIGDKAGKAATVSLTSATPPGGYPLLHRGFHWVSEYPFTR